MVRFGLAAMHHPTLRVLLTCHDLAIRAGTQLYTRDVAEELRALGHSPVVFSPRLGEVAAEMRARGVAVVDDLDRLGEPPSIIHGQHHLEAMAAMLRFPTVPALFVCHGWLPWQEAPPRFPTLQRYIAVDALRRDRLILENGIAESQVSILHNFVDLDRFRLRPPLPSRPRRALLLSNQATPQVLTPAVERACAESGIELAVAGFGTGRQAARPEELLRSADLVFARGRSALEAMAVGAAVILCDVEGCGPLVDTANFAALRDLNFGMGTLRPPVDPDRLRAAIERYDSAEAARVQEIVRREAGRKDAVARLVELYREILASPQEDNAAHTGDCLLAASRYVSWIGPALAAAGAELAAAETRLAETAATLETLERSPFSRLRSRLLGWGPLVSAWRAITGKPARRPA